MSYIANMDFKYSIKHVIYNFKKDEEVSAPSEDIKYMLKCKFIRDDKKEPTNNDSNAEQLKSAIAKIKEKMAKEMDASKLEKLDKKKQEFEAELAKLEA